MSANPNLISYSIKAALAVCVVLTILCLQLTNGASPAAGSAPSSISADNQTETASSSLEQDSVGQDSAAPSAGGECPLSNDYPESVRRWCEPLVEFANQHNLPPELIAALILQESGGDPSAYSRSGAVGLMQVMPRDGLAAEFMCVNGPCFASRPTIAELLDPEYNLEYGVGMLAGLIERTGEVREALKSYGPMDVEYSYADTVLAIYENYR